MHLEVQTLSVVTVFVTALLGALLIFAGLQNRGTRALMWWVPAYAVTAAALGLTGLRGLVVDVVAIDLAGALALLSYGMIWTGARIFDARRVRPMLLLLAPALWLVLCRFPTLAASVNIRVALLSAMLATLAACSAFEFWRGRDEQLMSRLPTVIVLLADAAVLLARIPARLLSPALGNDEVMSGVAFALLAFGTLLFTVITAFLLLNMTKERNELKHKIDSLIDPLRGVANRRAFCDGAVQMLHRQAVEQEPLAMLLFDLDWFKDINDRFGHAVGDRVLQVFADTASKTLGAEALFGRIGGEEFAALLAVGDLDEGYAIAERVRRNFFAAAARLGDSRLKPSVSCGVTLGCNPLLEVDALLAVADRALYRAKAHGRNRVETAVVDGSIETAVVDGSIEDAAVCAQSLVPLLKGDRADAAA